MRIVAILAVHEERPYLYNCLSHLIANGIEFAVVDNGSTDGSKELLHDQAFAPHLAGYLHVPFTGTFYWEKILRAQEQLLRTIEADWHLLLAPDEIMHSYVPGETLADAIARLDREGHDVINFDEFTFLPVDGDYVPDIGRIPPLRHYYFYEPKNPNQMRAWKKATGLSNIPEAGHMMSGGEFRLAPETFALRHYIFRSQAHAFEKYAKRNFAQEELARKWHLVRARSEAEHLKFPHAGELHCLPSAEDRHLERRYPWKRHYWERKD